MLFVAATIAIVGWMIINSCEAEKPEMGEATPYEGALYVPFIADDQIRHTDNVNVEYGNYEFWGATNGKVSVADKSRRGVLVSTPLNACNHSVDWKKLEWNGQGEVRFWVRVTVDNGESRGFPDQNAWTDWTELGNRKSVSISDEFDGKQFIQFKMELAGEAVVNEVRIYRLIMVPDHPRMFINRKQLEKVREAIENDPFKKGLFEKFKTYMDTQVVGQKFQRERGLWHIGGIGAALGMLYQLTGDRKYAEEAKIQLLRLSGPVEAGGETVEALKYSQQGEFDYSEVAREMPIVYDLIADALTPAERERFGEELVRIADFVEKTTSRYRFPDLCNQVYVKNVTAMMVGIGLYGDDLADEKAARWMAYADRNLHERLIPASNFWAADDGGWGEGPGYANFTASRFMQEVQSWRMATGENLFETASFFRYLTQWYLWITRPHNGRTVKFNDSSGSQPTLSYPSLLASLYNDGHAQYFADRYIQRAKADPTGYANMGLWCPIAYYDSNLKALEPEYPEQPTARHFEGVGQVVFRSGWDEDATFAVLKCQSFHSFGHRHADENEFLLDKMGSLAIESGVDQRSPGSHVQNYFTRTIAHNTITFKDPNEDTGEAANGGGQYQGEWRKIKSWHPGNSQHGAYNAGSPLWLNGGIVAFKTTKYYDYAVGNATEAYSSHKVDLFTRQVIYLKPNLFVMFDRVASDRPEFAKRWLLHTINKPNIDGNTTTITESKGKLIVTTLLPQDAELKLVGGSGQAFWVDGKNYPPPQPEKAFEPGGWRLEVQPGSSRKENLFLHTFYATAKDNTRFPDAKLAKMDDNAAVTIDYEGKQAIVTFAVAGEVTGHIVIKEGGKTLVDESLTQKVQSQVYPSAISP
jgi:heparin/heparan-sulfate lyase